MMTCIYKFKSGANKGNECGKEDCKNKKHSSGSTSTVARSVPKQIKPLTILDYAFLIKNEFKYIIKKQLHTTVLHVQENKPEEVYLDDKTDIAYETKYYILYRYSIIHNENNDDVKKVTFPINEYTKLDKLLESMERLDFLFQFADIKAMSIEDE